MRIAAIAISASLFATAALAEEAAPVGGASEQTDMRTHSVNANPIGALFGSYGVNYEYLFGGTHGLLVEGLFSHSSGDDASSTTGGGAVGYRWHWSGEQDSGFLGLNVGYSVGTGEATVTEDDEEYTFDVDVAAFTVIPNIGKRWAWDSGFNITLRFGVGYGNYDVTTDSEDELAQDAVEVVDDLLTILPVAFDGELSVGWVF